MSTGALREALGEALPERPFRVALWDGTELPATTPGDVPVFTLHSPTALGHMLRAPGQLGLGRAYVSGNLSVDDIDKTLALLADYKPAPVDARAKARIAAAAASTPRTSRATCCGSPRSPSARPGTTTTTPSRPRRSTACAAGSSTRRPG